MCAANVKLKHVHPVGMGKLFVKMFDISFAKVFLLWTVFVHQVESLFLTKLLVSTYTFY